ncbi:motility associated factor glycosyltransferase family protein [Metabacillus sp. B2-18]|uniref:motility associated factor glycosyltransferase family protein n=1 Tax=Metabacillus sp. B2-18 TaxID=2897333 RepID=UPI001E3C364A|nr:6-hydroxymethylpterin diphosphokinase MptE-like protein [Metabacillus sp. B2-18]UGB30432.1 DUF115 domain-containing protein [Metabacillus sp. B2-18]
MKWRLIQTASGDFTVVLTKKEREFLLHSKYDPVKEAKRWVTQWDVESKNPKRICVIGMGAGFHIIQLRKIYPSIPIIVFDFNPDYYNWLEEIKCISKLKTQNITINVSDDLKTIKEGLLPLLDDSDFMIMLHAPSLELIPDNLSSIKTLLEDYMFFLRTIRKNNKLLEENLFNNLRLEDKGITGWKNKLDGKSVLLISAGPSLSKQIPIIKAASLTGEVFIACVGTALTPLLKSRIIPNAIMISDPQITILEQFVETTKDMDIPLFYLGTANHEGVKQYQGPRYIVWQKGYSKSEELSQLRDEPKIKTGGSVATCLLDLLIWFGASRIALVGQDLAYTNGYSHAKGTHNVKKMELEKLIEVKGYYQNETVKTPKHLYGYLKWFEKYVVDFRGNVELWNCTEGGAFIKGWKHNSLEQFLKSIN